MGRFAVVCCVLAMAVAACFFEPVKPSDHVGGGSDGGVDAPPDTLPCSGTATCNGDTLHIACTTGSAVDVTCGWGCGGSGSAHCLVLDPTGGAASSADTQGLPGGSLTVPAAVLDTDALTLSPALATIDARIDRGVAIFRFGSLSVAGSLTVRGTNALAIIADGTIEISGTLDVTGGCGSNDAGPGGVQGGLAGQPAQAPTGGGEVTGNGGGGGGLGGMGGPGGHKNSTTSATGGAVLGGATIMTLVGGGGGGGGGDSSGGMGGGGGGAVQLISNTRIVVDSGAVINASGCGGYGPGTAQAAAGGGGAGGMIVLEAPAISLAGTLAVNGGGGGGGDQNGTRGGNGSASTQAAAGGSSPSTGDLAAGGSGAADTIATGGTGGNAVHSGGGGGGVGWMRFNTRPAGLTMTGATLSPGFGTTGTTTGGLAATH